VAVTAPLLVSTVAVARRRSNGTSRRVHLVPGERVALGSGDARKQAKATLSGIPLHSHRREADGVPSPRRQTAVAQLRVAPREPCAATWRRRWRDRASWGLTEQELDPRPAEHGSRELAPLAHRHPILVATDDCLALRTIEVLIRRPEGRTPSPSRSAPRLRRSARRQEPPEGGPAAFDRAVRRALAGIDRHDGKVVAHATRTSASPPTSRSPAGLASSSRRPSWSSTASRRSRPRRLRPPRHDQPSRRRRAARRAERSSHCSATC
jgi:hypothetical protein